MAQDLDGWLPLLLQTTDSIFPTGSYAHSFGLEGVVQLGIVKDAATLRTFLENTVLPSLERVELPTVHHAHAAALDGNCERICQIDHLYGALKGTSELRQASIRLGTQRLAMLLQIAPHPLLEAIETARARGELEGHAPVLFGVQTGVAGSPLQAGLLAAYYQNLSAMLSASMKLIRLGQNACQALLTELMRHGPAIAARSQDVALEDIGWFTPALDIASARHETAYTRLFIS